MAHTEHVHILYGAGLVLIGSLWLASLAYPAPVLRWSWTVLVVLLGLSLVVPTETQARTYLPVGAWDTLQSVIPDSLDTWLESVRKPHVIQHKVAGVCAMLGGLVELVRGTGRLRGSGWRWALPGLAVGAAIAIGVHGGTSHHLPRVGEQAHHWILGSGLGLGSVAYAYGQRAGRPLAWCAALPAALVVAGLDWALRYRVG